MAFINYLPPDQIDPLDQVPDNDRIIQIHSVHSRVMRLHYDLYVEVMHRPGPLTRMQREMIGVVVSSINGCHYWLVHHSRGLRRELENAAGWKRDAETSVRQMAADYRSVDLLSNRDRAMLDYASKLTLTPRSITRQDVEKLRDTGFDDRAIHDICAIASYFAFVNRIADGLGVELESEDLQ